MSAPPTPLPSPKAVAPIPRLWVSIRALEDQTKDGKSNSLPERPISPLELPPPMLKRSPPVPDKWPWKVKVIDPCPGEAADEDTLQTAEPVLTSKWKAYDDGKGWQELCEE